jgi:hypothetical protein
LIFSKTHEKRKKIGKYIAYCILGLMIAAGLLAPIIVSVMKKPPTYYVSHRSTSKPGRFYQKKLILSTVRFVIFYQKENFFFD